MNEITGFVLAVVLAAVFFYVLYIGVRRAVAGGIRDARDAFPADAPDAPDARDTARDA